MAECMLGVQRALNGSISGVPLAASIRLGSDPRSRYSLGGSMAKKRLSPRRPVGWVTRLLVVGGIVATSALVLPAAAPAAPTDPPAAQHLSARELSAVGAAVRRSGVDGIAWYVDNAADRVVVTAD